MLPSTHTRAKSSEQCDAHGQHMHAPCPPVKPHTLKLRAYGLTGGQGAHICCRNNHAHSRNEAEVQ